MQYITLKENARLELHLPVQQVQLLFVPCTQLPAEVCEVKSVCCPHPGYETTLVSPPGQQCHPALLTQCCVLSDK